VKDHGVLHPELARTLASAGHGDLVGLADAGLPIPAHTPRIDLAFAPGKPQLLDVLDAVLTELYVEAAWSRMRASKRQPGCWMPWPIDCPAPRSYGCRTRT